MRREGASAAALLAALAAILAHSAARVGPTFDEPLHVTAGRVLWETGDHRLNLEHGAVPRLALAFPARGAALPRLDSEAWRRVPSMGFPFVRECLDATPQEWRGHIERARGVNLVVALALAIAVWRWARALFGPGGGLAALALWCLCPTALAHGGLATTDVWSALAFTLAAWRWDRLWTAPSARRLGLSAAATAFLFVVKLSAPLFLPAAALGAALRHATGQRQRARTVLAWLALHALAAWGAIWAAHGFRHALFAPGHALHATPTEPWETLLPEPGPTRRAVDAVRAWKLLPEGFVYGALYARKHSLTRPAFLLGEYSETRFAAYFPAAFVLKTPPATLLALACAGWLWLRGGWRHAAAPGALALAYGGLAAATAPNIGVRHLLPALAAGHVLLGALAVTRGGRWLLGAAIALGAAEAAFQHPQHLAYFTPAVGGWRAGHALLADSNLDWGQNHEAIGPWLHAPPPDAPPRSAHFVNTIPARRLGFEERPPFATQLRLDGYDPRADYAGEVLIAASTLRWVEQSSPAASARMIARGAAAARRLRAGPPEDERRALLEALADAGHAALRRHCQRRAPDDQPAPGLLVFRFSDAAARGLLTEAGLLP